MEKESQLHIGKLLPSLLWAKAKKAESSWHSLTSHMIDTLFVTQQLWTQWLTEATKQWLEEPFIDGPVEAYCFFSWIAALHDIGKASPAFQTQVKIPNQLELAEKENLIVSDNLIGKKKAPHSLVSGVVLNKTLKEKGFSKHTAQQLAAILGGHHGIFPNSGHLKDYERFPLLYGDANWEKARSQAFDLITCLSKADSYLFRWRELDLGRARELTTTGLIILADWIASNEKLFPYEGHIDDQYLKMSEKRASQSLNSIGWEGTWKPQKTQNLYQKRFGFFPRPVQQVAVQAAFSMMSPGLILIEAPMGEGKTEAALAAAEIFANRFGSGGLFVGLPTQATTNQMFLRIRKWLKNQSDTEKFLISLAHSKAFLEKTYQELLQQAPTEVGIDEEIKQDADTPQVVASEWFAGRKRPLLATFSIGTIDQFLLAVARSRHVALRQFGLSGKVLVVDEVHSYDVYMSVFLLKALNWLGSQNTPVILLSATLAPSIRSKLFSAYLGNSSFKQQLDSSYPLVSYIKDKKTSEVASIKVPGPFREKQVQIELIDEDSNLENLDSLFAFIELLKRGGNCLIIRNTVVRAQKTYKVLQSQFDLNELILIHSRFTLEGRSLLEEELMEKFGSNSVRPYRQVVVSTQVLEQSLDIDFDLLITDLAPIDLIFQRIGRIHRHEISSRPKSLAIPKVVIGGWERSKEGFPPIISRGSSAIYDENILLKTALVLQGRKTFSIPKDISSLVEQVYDLEPEFVPNRSWQDQLNHTKEEKLKLIEERRNKAEQFAFPDLGEAGDSLIAFNYRNLGEVDEDGPSIQAHVRDGSLTVEVILLQRIDETTACLVSDPSIIIPLNRLPSLNLEKLLTQTLRLPESLTESALNELQIPKGWKRHPWLSKSRLLLIDSQRQTYLSGFLIRYSSTLGLEVTFVS